MRLLVDQPLEGPKNTTDDDRSLFDIDLVAELLGRVLLQTEPRFNLGIYGGWGSGKTSLMNLVASKAESYRQRELSDEHVLFVKFPAWPYQLHDQMLLPLLQHLHSEVKDAAKNDRQRGTKWSEFRLIDPSTFRVLFKKLGAIDFMGTSLGQATDTLGDERDQFAKAAVFDKHVPPRHRVIVLIDDLDRCPPAVGLGLLDALKGVLDTVGLIFVLAIDDRALHEAIRQKYSESIDPQAYLRKIIQVSWQIDVPTLEERKRFVREAQKTLSTNNPQPTVDSALDENLVSLLAEVEDNPRQIIEALNVAALRGAAIQGASAVCVLMWSLMQKKWSRAADVLQRALHRPKAPTRPGLRQDRQHEREVMAWVQRFALTRTSYSPINDDQLRFELRRLTGGRPSFEEFAETFAQELCVLLAKNPAHSAELYRAVSAGEARTDSLKKFKLQVYRFGGFLTYLPITLATNRFKDPAVSEVYVHNAFLDTNTHDLTNTFQDGTISFGVGDPADVGSADSHCKIVAKLVVGMPLWVVSRQSTSAAMGVQSARIASYGKGSTAHALVTASRFCHLSRTEFKSADELQAFQQYELVVMQEPFVSQAVSIGAAGVEHLAPHRGSQMFTCLYTHQDNLKDLARRRVVQQFLRELQSSLEYVGAALIEQLVEDVEEFQMEPKVDAVVLSAALNRLKPFFPKTIDVQSDLLSDSLELRPPESRRDPAEMLADTVWLTTPVSIKAVAQNRTND